MSNKMSVVICVYNYPEVPPTLFGKRAFPIPSGGRAHSRRYWLDGVVTTENLLQRESSSVINTLRNYFGETRGRTSITTAKALCNKAVYCGVRAALKPPAEGWVHSRWHWFGFPFSLQKQILWSRPLRAWFRPLSLGPHDMDQQSAAGRPCRCDPEQRANVEWIEKFSNDAAKNWTKTIDFLFLDGDHNQETVLQDWESWRHFVAPGGWVAFHDTREFPGGWPLATDGPVRVVNALFSAPY
jgi:hypothetical protein